MDPETVRKIILLGIEIATFRAYGSSHKAEIGVYHDTKTGELVCQRMSIGPQHEHIGTVEIRSTSDFAGTQHQITEEATRIYLKFKANCS